MRSTAGRPTADSAPQMSVTGRHLPGLDGLRAVAVAAVIAYHLGYGWASGGYLGVDLFFVLSGYLITSLLLEAWVGEGAVGVRGFWGRRAKRLLPGLLVMLIVVVGFVATQSSGLPIDWHGLRDGALATVGYVANWQLLFSHQSYFDRFAVVSPLRHTWSLAIEEQFYLVWPLVIAAVVRVRRWRGTGLVLTVVGAIASAAWMAYLFRSGASVDRLYYGTDTRAFDLLAGACVAMLAAGRPQPSERARRLLRRGGVIALAVLALVSGFAGAPDGFPRSWMFEGGFALAAAAAAVVIAEVRCAEPGPLGRVLSIPPLRYIGRISYGLYLWHWPVIVELTPARAHASGLLLASERVGLTLALSVASFHLIEQPIRHGWPRSLRSWRRVALAPLAMVGTAAVVMLGTVPPTVATASAGQIVTTAATAEVPGAGGVVGRPLTIGRPVTHDHRLRVLLLGDSVMLSEFPAVQALFGSTGEAVVENHSQWGFGLSVLKNWRAAIPQWIAAARPDIVVVMWSWDNAAYQAHPAAYTSELEQFVRLVLTPGDGVSGIIFQQFPIPGPGVVTSTSAPDYDARVPRLVARFNALEASMPAKFPGKVDYVPVGTAVTEKGHFATWLPPEGRASAPKRDWLRVRQVDNVHFCPAGAARYAAALYADVRPMFRLGRPAPGWQRGRWTRNYLAYRYPDAGVCPDDHPPGG